MNSKHSFVFEPCWTFVAPIVILIVGAVSGCGGGGSGTSGTGASSNTSSPVTNSGGTSNASATNVATTSGTANSGTTSGAGGTSSTSSGGSSGAATSGAAGSMAVAGVGCSMPTPGATSACTSYQQTTIVDMRQGQTNGCFELPGVTLVARTDSPSEPRLYVQDAGGSDFSAILAKCATGGSYVCSDSVRAKIPQLYDTFEQGAQLTLRGAYQYGNVSGFEQFYIEDVIDECLTAPRPAPITLSESDIERDARLPALWFQRANVTISADDPLVMYDFSPADLSLAAPECPDSAGFAMVPRSQGTSVPDGCNGSANPASRALDPREVLIGRQFFQQFLYSADCACNANTGQILVSPTSTVSGTIRGYLILEVDSGSTNPYQVFQAAADQTFPMQ